MGSLGQSGLKKQKNNLCSQHDFLIFAVAYVVSAFCFFLSLFFLFFLREREIESSHACVMIVSAMFLGRHLVTSRWTNRETPPCQTPLLPAT